MTFEDLISLCKPTGVYGPEPDVIGTLTNDSRNVTENSVFIAVKGLQADGHHFIDDAVARGASVIICEDPPANIETAVLEVADTRSLVGPLAQVFEGNPGDRLKLIGITGTNGKTTVATLVYQVLQKLETKPSLLGTVAKRIADQQSDSLLTTSDPVELAADMRKMVDAGSTHLVMEVSSHALDQSRVNGLNFLVAAFTNLSHDHLDYHQTLQEYAGAKKKLFDALNPDAWAVVNADDEKAEFMTMDTDARVIDFSFRKKAAAECKILTSSQKGLKVKVDSTEIESPMVGKFNAYNIAAAFLICRALGYEDNPIAEALEDSAGAAGRLERVQSRVPENRPLVLVDYAHTPDALKNVLQTLSDLKMKGQKLHVIFGCGGNRDRSKRPKMAQIAESYADAVTVTSDNPRNEDPDAIIDEIMSGFTQTDIVDRITDRRKAIQHVVENSDKDTLILIAGKGHETYQEIKGRRYDFDDRKIAREALGNLEKKGVS